MANKNEAKITFTAQTKGFDDALKQSKKTISQLNSELQLNAAEMKNADDSAEFLVQRQGLLQQKLEASQNKVDALNNKLAVAKQIYGENSDEVARLQRQLTTAQTEVQKVTTALNTNAGQLDAVRAASVDTRTEFERLEDTIAAQEKELTDLKREYSAIVLEQGETSQAARELAGKITDLTGELKTNRSAYTDAARAADDLGNASEDAGEKAEDSADGYTVLKDVVADMASNAISAAVDGFKELALEGDKALDVLAAKTGASADKAAEYSDVVNSLYKDALGESVADVADALGTVVTMTDNLDKTSLENVTRNALVLRDIYGFDVAESMRAVNGLTKQFGITSDEAFNLIVQGAQNGLNQNGDLLDVINEYSVQFADVGYNADDMFNMLRNGADAGTWSVDKLGDAFKEFNIRVSDGTANEYLENLGLDADDVVSRFNAGGETAKGAIGEIITALVNCEDETAQYTNGVGLLGTMYEDMGLTALSALFDTEGQINKTNEAMSEADATAYNNAATDISALGRTLKTDLIEPIAGALLPAIQGVLGFAAENIPVVTTLLAGLAAAWVAQKVALISSQIATSGMTAAQWLLNAAMSANPIGIIVMAVAALVAAIIYLWNNCDAFREFFIGLWDGIKNVVQIVVDWFVQAWTDIGTFFTNLWNGIVNVFNTTWAAIVSFFTTIGTWVYETVIAPIGQFFTDLWNGIVNAFHTVIDPWIEIVKRASVWVYDTIIKPVADFFVNLWTGIKDGATAVWDGIKNVFSVVANWFNNTIVQPVKNVFTGLWDGLKNGASSAWQGIKSVFSNVTNWFKDVFSKAWQAVKNVFSAGGKIFDGIKDGIVSAFKTVVNAIIKGINKVITVPFNAINTVLRKIKGIEILGVSPFGWVNTFSVPQIPLLAKGGIVDRPTLNIAGEAGAEAITPIDKLQGYIDAAVNKAMGGVQLQNLIDAVQRLADRPIELDIDGVRFAEATATASDNVNGNRVNLKNRGLAL